MWYPVFLLWLYLYHILSLSVCDLSTERAPTQHGEQHEKSEFMGQQEHELGNKHLQQDRDKLPRNRQMNMVLFSVVVKSTAICAFVPVSAPLPASLSAPSFCVQTHFYSRHRMREIAFNLVQKQSTWRAPPVCPLIPARASCHSALNLVLLTSS